MLIVDRDKWVLFELFGDQMEWRLAAMGGGIGCRLRSVFQRATP